MNIDKATEDNLSHTISTVIEVVADGQTKSVASVEIRLNRYDMSDALLPLKCKGESVGSRLAFGTPEHLIFVECLI